MDVRNMVGNKVFGWHAFRIDFRIAFGIAVILSFSINAETKLKRCLKERTAQQTCPYAGLHELKRSDVSG